jgi:hypothetical protein
MLPSYIEVPTAELMFAIAEWLESNGYLREENTRPKTFVPKSYVFQTRPKVLKVENNTVCWFSTESRDDSAKVNSFSEFLALQEPKIKVGEFSVVPSEKGIQVGCTFVPWDKVEAILALKPCN